MSKSHADDGQLWRLDAAELARLLRARVISAREATESALNRLAEVNSRINAVVDVMADEARAAADLADKAFAAGKEIGPLHGVPVTVKINVDTCGRGRPCRGQLAQSRCDHYWTDQHARLLVPLVHQQ
jgi:amidase